MLAADLHDHIFRRIELVLGPRSWAWLARESGVPQSTLATQRSKARISVAALFHVARALDRPVEYFLPATQARPQCPCGDALDRIVDIADCARAKGP